MTLTGERSYGWVPFCIMKMCSEVTSESVFSAKTARKETSCSLRSMEKRATTPKSSLWRACCSSAVTIRTWSWWSATARSSRPPLSPQRGWRRATCWSWCSSWEAVSLLPAGKRKIEAAARRRGRHVLPHGMTAG